MSHEAIVRAGRCGSSMSGPRIVTTELRHRRRICIRAYEPVLRELLRGSLLTRMHAFFADQNP
jgi:hypothetical protein